MTDPSAESIFIQAPGATEAVRELWPPETMKILRDCRDKHEPALNYSFSYQELTTQYMKQGSGYEVMQIQFIPHLKSGLR